MSLSVRLNELIRAGFTGIWINSCEQQDALVELATMCRAESWQLLGWNIEQGLHQVGQSASDTQPADPLSAIRAMTVPSLEHDTRVLVLENFHRLLGSAEIVQALLNAIEVGKVLRSFIVILSPTVQLPSELEKLFVTVEHELPSRDQLLEIARGIATEANELPSGNKLDAVLDAAGGVGEKRGRGYFRDTLVGTIRFS